MQHIYYWVGFTVKPSINKSKERKKYTLAIASSFSLTYTLAGARARRDTNAYKNIWQEKKKISAPRCFSRIIYISNSRSCVTLTPHMDTAPQWFHSFSFVWFGFCAFIFVSFFTWATFVSFHPRPLRSFALHTFIDCHNFIGRVRLRVVSVRRPYASKAEAKQRRDVLLYLLTKINHISHLNRDDNYVQCMWYD